MVNPRTVNAGIIVPLTGADVDLWGEIDVNPNMVAIDGFIGGVQPIAVTGAAPLTLSAPSGFTATPSPGPTQSQNRVLRFTGALAANQQVTLPLPSVYVIENLTTGNFLLTFRGAVAATEIVAVPQGERVTIYNDGSNVRFVDLGHVGKMEHWAGLSAMPAWVTACTVPPYLPCEGGTGYLFSQFPYLGQRMGAAFGGNGITTFGVPDMRGRMPLGYDGTGARITVAGGAGFDGQTIGAGGGIQYSQLITNNLPPYTPQGNIITGNVVVGWTVDQYQPPGGGAKNALNSIVNTGSAGTAVITNFNGWGFQGSAQGGTSQIFSNVPPAQVTGLWVIKT